MLSLCIGILVGLIFNLILFFVSWLFKYQENKAIEREIEEEKERVLAVLKDLKEINKILREQDEELFLKAINNTEGMNNVDD